MASYVDFRHQQSHIQEMGHFNHFWVNHSREWVNQIFGDVHKQRRAWLEIPQIIYLCNQEDIINGSLGELY